ncbi:MAG: 4Fe-4S binding protein [Coriobacteriia bacterium]|nr:4Fe-4S binding protein [Coriobacteriia bacterium]
MKRWLIARRIIQVAVWVILAAPILIYGFSLFGLTAGSDMRMPTPSEAFIFGSLSSSDIFGLTLIDPYATLQVALASRSIEIAWIWAFLPAFILYLVIGARAFCGWICPVNLVLEFTEWLRKKFNLPNANRSLPRKTKLAVMVLFLLLAFVLAQPLFENISPIAALGKTLLFGSFAGFGTLIGIIILELFWAPRIWCRSLCPLGGFYQLFGRIGIFRPHVDRSQCTSCGDCKAACIVDPVILEPALTGESTKVWAGDCMRCGACIDACPSKCIKMKTY